MTLQYHDVVMSDYDTIMSSYDTIYSDYRVIILEYDNIMSGCKLKKKTTITFFLKKSICNLCLYIGQLVISNSQDVITICLN